MRNNRPPFDTENKRNDATCAGKSGPGIKSRAKNMRRPPFDGYHICHDETATVVNGKWICHCPK